jgi:uncharacterized protein with ATP-grasp and redox domains
MRYTTDDQQLQDRLLRDVLRTISEMDLNTSPPLMTQAIHRFIRARTSAQDPYRTEKAKFNRIALELYPTLESRVQASTDPLETAVKLAIAGNVIDLGANSHLSQGNISEEVEEALDVPFNGDLAAFRDTISRAARILYLTDNAGEIVFDRLLIEQLPREKITAGVRGFPILNDATMSDALATGLTKVVKVIDNGSDAPGTSLKDCSPEFRNCFEEADLVIAKGQGNYETLDESKKEIFFLLKIKCPVIARDIGCDLGSLVLKKGDG